MASMIRGLKAALAILFLWPMIGNAVPILAPPNPNGGIGISGWSNSRGNFVIEPRGLPNLSTFNATASYSTAASLFSVRDSQFAFIKSLDFPFLDFIPFHPGEVRLDAVIRENGTVSGDIISSIFTVRAGVDGIPQAGIAGNETVVVGHAIDTAALTSSSFSYSSFILLDLTYTHPAFSSLGRYVTFLGPYANSWWDPVAAAAGFPNGIVGRPWGVNWNAQPFESPGFVRTNALPEPGTLALLSFGLLGLALTRRRKQ